MRFAYQVNGSSEVAVHAAGQNRIYQSQGTITQDRTFTLYGQFDDHSAVSLEGVVGSLDPEGLKGLFFIAGHAKTPQPHDV